MTVNAFERFIDRVLAHEGGYVNHPQDPGGETNWGVTIATARANGYTGSMKAMTRQDAVEIYRRAFWQLNHCDHLPPALAYQYFDACINHGAVNAAKMLQRALGVAADGAVGPQTLAAVAQADPMALILQFNRNLCKTPKHLSCFGVSNKNSIICPNSTH